MNIFLKNKQFKKSILALSLPLVLSACGGTSLKLPTVFPTGTPIVPHQNNNQVDNDNTDTNNQSNNNQPVVNNPPVVKHPNKPTNTKPNNPVIIKPNKPVINQPINNNPIIKPQPHITKNDISAVLSERAVQNSPNAIPALTAKQNQEVQQALVDTNKLRAEVGHSPLVMDKALQAYAQKRAEEIAQKFSHDRPNGNSALNYIRVFGWKGENIAGGNASADETVLDQWRHSPGHYKNIISSNFNKIGIGYAIIPNSDFRYYWTQVFAGGDQVDTDYHFAITLPNIPYQNITDVQNNRLIIKGGQNVVSNASFGSQYGSLHHPIYRHSKQFNYNDSQVIIQDNANTDFAYQTFAEIRNLQGIPVQYASVGIPTKISPDTEIHANYKGASIGSITDGDPNQSKHVYADINAKIDFGAEKKQLTIRLSNTSIAQGGDISQHRPQTNVTNGSSWLNFTNKLDWDSQHQEFILQNDKDYIKAKLYGPDASELGGTFNKGLTGRSYKTYKGAFGAKRTQ